MLITTFIVLATLLFIQSLASLRDGQRFLKMVRAAAKRPRENYAPPAAVIVPVKGACEGMEQNLDAFFHQDYPSYQLIFVVASRQEAAHRWLTNQLAERAQRVRDTAPAANLVVAGYSDERGEKVNNLLRGLEAVAPGTEVLVFADMDARPGRDWLSSLVAPLAGPNVTVSTGFRWYLPGPSFASQLRAAWDTSIATLMGDHKDNFAWGGSMAIRAADFRRLGVAERSWAHTASDDYALTRAVREAGGKIHFVPRCLVWSREDSSLREFFHWANRQIIITRVYARHLWRLGLAAHVLYAGAFLSGIALAVVTHSAPLRWAVAGALLAILLLGVAKARVRTIVARELFPEERETLERYGARYWQLQPLVPWIMLGNFVLAGFKRTIEWGGVRYQLISPDRLRVLGRERP